MIDYGFKHEDIKDVNALLTDFKKADYDSELAQITNELIILESKEKRKKNYKKSRRKSLKNKINSLQDDIEEESQEISNQLMIPLEISRTLKVEKKK